MSVQFIGDRLTMGLIAQAARFMRRSTNKFWLGFGSGACGSRNSLISLATDGAC